MSTISRRQREILEIIKVRKSISTADILKLYPENISKVTVLRDLEVLLDNHLISKTGIARNTKYCPLYTNELLEYFDVNDYFGTSFDKRNIRSERFEFSIFDKLTGLFNPSELHKLDLINEKFSSNINKINKGILQKEFERLTIEFSWKSSQIEGNTYTLLDTERLIKDNIEAEGHRKEEAIMILNHKNTLEYIFDNRDDFEIISLNKIEDIHKMLVKDLDVSFFLRNSAVGIVGTNYKPLDNKFQIEEAVQKLVKAINNDTLHPIEKALISILMISYIQPFEDGNKRTARILANAILWAYGYCPLSYRSIDELEYKKAIILFYEQNSALYFKELFVQQFEQAVEKYF